MEKPRTRDVMMNKVVTRAPNPLTTDVLLMFPEIGIMNISFIDG